MSATIADLSSYGDVKGRDSYARNILQSVKGDGVSANYVTQGFYGIPSATEVEYEMARLTVSEGVFDDEIGTITFGVRDGSSLNDVMTMNNTASEITTTTFTMNTTDVYSTGILNVATIQENAAAEGSRIELVSDVSDPNINFVLGDLDGTPSMPLVISEAIVAVTGTLTIDGTDVGALITDGNPWDTTLEPTTFLKADFDLVEINVVNAYSTTLSLDVNGAIAARGNRLQFFDSVTATDYYNVLVYDDVTTNLLTVQAPRTGDSLAISTTDGTSNSMLARLTFDDGAATTNALFSNVFVGINTPSPSGTYSLEITGNAFVSTGLTSTGDVDLVGNNLLNVTQIESDATVAEQARIVLTSDATDPTIELIVGDMSGTPTTAATFTEVLTTVTTPTTFSDNVIVTGDLTVNGTTVTFNTTTVEVEDISIEMGTLASTLAEVNGGGIILGPGTGGIIPSMLYNSTTDIWETSIGLNIPTGETLSVGTTTEITDGEVALNTDSAFFYFGVNKQWRMGIINDLDGDHFQIAHDDLGTQTTYVVKLDVLQ